MTLIIALYFRGMLLYYVTPDLCTWCVLISTLLCELQKLPYILGVSEVIYYL